jgi:repressor LexA
MKYHELLTSCIAKSGISLREIARRCGEKGLKVDYSYISKLKHNAMPPASDKVNEILANVLDADPDLLILAAYRSRIPGKVLKMLSTGTDND